MIVPFACMLGYRYNADSSTLAQIQELAPDGWGSLPALPDLLSLDQKQQNYLTYRFTQDVKHDYASSGSLTQPRYYFVSNINYQFKFDPISFPAFPLSLDIILESIAGMQMSKRLIMSPDPDTQFRILLVRWLYDQGFLLSSEFPLLKRNEVNRSS
jgi:hypothetical protein